MGDLRPIGSEKLSGMDKINRIMEIATYRENNNRITESNVSYSIQLSDGNYYGIVNEKNGYIVKRGINESNLDYMEPMQNRKYFNSYSQAMKKLNLMAGEINRITEHKENISLIGERKKFVLKTPDSGASDMGIPAETPAPPMDDAGMDMGMDDAGMDMGDDAGLDMGMDDAGMDMGDDTGLDMDMPDMEGEPKDDEGDVTFKVVQKLTGKLGQKLRTLDSNEGLSSEDIKYVLNSIISAVNLEKLNEEDLEDILSNFEEEEIDYDEMEGDMDMGADDEEMDLDMELGDEGSDIDSELAENAKYYGNDEFGWHGADGQMYGPGDMDYDYEDNKDFDFLTLNKFAPHLVDARSAKLGDKNIKNLRLRYKNPIKNYENPIKNYEEDDEYDTFVESKVDKILSKYYDISEEENTLNESKKVKSFINEKIEKVTNVKKIKELSSTFEQENTSTFLMNENKEIKLIGKTNKGNLVFNLNEKEFKVSPLGEVL